MARSAPKACTSPGCRGAAVSGGRCAAHKQQESQRYERERGSAASRGYGYRWQKYAASYLRAHPLCVECEKAGRVTPATEVDHIVPHRGDMVLFWKHDNHQGLCKPCHSAKTAREDGRWG